MLLNLADVAYKYGLHADQFIKDVVASGVECVRNDKGQVLIDEDVLDNIDPAIVDENQLVDVVTIAMVSGLNYSTVRRFLQSKQREIRSGFAKGKSKVLWRKGDAKYLKEDREVKIEKVLDMVPLDDLLDVYNVHREWLMQDIDRLGITTETVNGVVMVDKGPLEVLLKSWEDQYISGPRFADEMGVEYVYVKTLMRKYKVDKLANKFSGPKKVWRRGDLEGWFMDILRKTDITVDEIEKYFTLSMLTSKIKVKPSLIEYFMYNFPPSEPLRSAVIDGKTKYHEDDFNRWVMDASHRDVEIKCESLTIKEISEEYKLSDQRARQIAKRLEAEYGMRTKVLRNTMYCNRDDFDKFYRQMLSEDKVSR